VRKYFRLCSKQISQCPSLLPSKTLLKSIFISRANAELEGAGRTMVDSI